MKEKTQDWGIHLEIWGHYKECKSLYCGCSWKGMGLGKTIKLANIKHEDRTIKVAKLNCEAMMKLWWTYISLSAIVSAEIVKRKIWVDIFKTQKEKRRPPQILQITKLTLHTKGQKCLSQAKTYGLYNNDF